MFELSYSTVAIVAVAAYGVYSVVRFALADADLSLLSKGAHSPKAFDGKVVWITGASQGIGAALAQYLAAQGAKLIISARSKEGLQDVKTKCKTSPDNVVVLPFDMCGSDLDAITESAVSTFPGGIDYLVLNAGVGQAGLATEANDEVTESMFCLNALAPIKLTKAILPSMLKKKGGRIVCVSSIAGLVPAPGQAVYAATKMAIHAYIMSLSAELADQGVGFTLVCPGPIATGLDKTRMVYGADGIKPAAPSSAADLKAKMPTRRFAELMANAMAHGVDVCWISRHPVLLIGYLYAFVPSIVWMIMKKVGPKRARALAAGKSGYDMSNMK